MAGGGPRSRWAAVAAVAVAIALVGALLLVVLGPGGAPRPEAARRAAPAAPAPRPAGEAPAASPEPLAASATPPSTPPAGPTAGAAPADPEDAAMARVRALVDPDPRAALAQIDELERTAPAGRLADERTFLKMRGLVNLGEISLARSEAKQFYDRFPGSGWGRRVYQLTGVHPPPRPR